MQRMKDAYLTRLRKTFDASYEGDGTVVSSAKPEGETPRKGSW